MPYATPPDESGSKQVDRQQQIRYGWALPFFVLFVVVTFGAFWPPGMRPAPQARWQMGAVAYGVDWTVHAFGNLLPFASVVLRALGFGGKRPLEIRIPVVLMLGIALLRIVIFFFVERWHYYFSDHIFLATSLMAMEAVEVRQCWTSSPLLFLNAVFCFGVMFEAWHTSRYYHTQLASMLALVVGSALFGGLSFPGLEEVLDRCCHRMPDKRSECQALIPNEA
mmetsp:Transcript_118046/g.338624  ORF Transcript_118046/g.338624 Transcript_118046/m.338624 type:complete len:223 (+) Transcript_118046:71-739(+)